MVLWLKNSMLVVNDQGVPIDCDYCPCQPPEPSGDYEIMISVHLWTGAGILWSKGTIRLNCEVAGTNGNFTQSNNCPNPGSIYDGYCDSPGSIDISGTMACNTSGSITISGNIYAALTVKNTSNESTTIKAGDMDVYIVRRDKNNVYMEQSVAISGTITNSGAVTLGGQGGTGSFNPSGSFSTTLPAMQQW